MRIAVLLGAWFMGHYAYHLAPTPMQADASNIGRSLASLMVLAVLLSVWRSPLIWPVAAGIAAEEAQVVVCSVMWLVEPWPMEPWQERCSERLGVPLGSIGIAALGALAVAAASQKDRHDNPV